MSHICICSAAVSLHMVELSAAPIFEDCSVVTVTVPAQDGDGQSGAGCLQTAHRVLFVASDLYLQSAVRFWGHSHMTRACEL